MTILRAFLTMPDSEQAYKQNKDLIDTVLPSHGGAIQADGSWVEEDARVNNSFASELPTLARGAGQRYVPVARMEPTADSKTFLDNQGLWAGAAAALVADALTDRFDAPWDGVGYEFDSFFDAYNQKHEQFMVVLSTAVRAAGLSFEVPFHAVTTATESSQVSLDVIAQVADVVDYYIYIWGESPYSLSPWWWAVESIEHVLTHGISPSNIYLGLTNLCRHVPDPEVAYAPECSYAQAMQLVANAGASIEWMEEHATGAIRECYASLGEGYVWITDGDVLAPRLGLVNQYGLAGAMLFTPGVGDEFLWGWIAQWKQPIERAANDPILIRHGPQCCPVPRDCRCK